MKPHPVLVTTSQKLEALCRDIRSEGVCGFDTEFVFERTYYPRLGLIQLSAPSGIAGAVDPLSVKDLGPALDLLLDDRIKKIVHAGGMDWKIVAQLSGRLPQSVFDTQIAASFLGFGPQIGYAPLVESVLDIRVDKSETYTDWLQRPLRQEQITYALSDVTHLLKVQRHLESELERRGRLSWAVEEFRRSVHIDLYADPDPYAVFLDIRRSSSLGRRELAVLRELAAWREMEAKTRDLRPHFVLKDDVLLALARRAPRSEPDLLQVRGITSQEITRSGPDILKAIQRARKLPDTEWPAVEKGEPPEPGLDAAVNLLQSYLQIRAKELDLATETLLTKGMLKAIVRQGENATSTDGTPILKGWRKELLGTDFLDLLNGQMTLGLDPKTRKLKIYPAAR